MDATKESEIKTCVEQFLPEFSAACRSEEGEGVLMTQEAFGDSVEEIVMLGMALKYAGLYGKVVTVAPHPKD